MSIKLHVYFTKKGRGGKTVTIVSGFEKNDQDIPSGLDKELKKHCGVGGTIKNNEVILQGNVVDKAKKYLVKNGYTTN